MSEAVSARPSPPSRRVIVPTLGLMQILAWGSTYYLLAVLAKPIAADTGWSLTWTVGALSLGILISGFAAPHVGKAIDRWGGRPVLGASALMFAAGLTLLALSPHLIVFVMGWIVLGAGMAAGLYDAAFSTLGRMYGEAARQPITAVTFFGGLASTACWPLTAYLGETLGWRGACLAYAALHLFVVCPAYWLILPREVAGPRQAAANTGRELPPSTTFALLATTFAVTAAITGANSVHLLTFLQDRGVALSAAVALGTLVGPAQVTARVIEMFAGRYHHPIWTLAASAMFVAAGTALLWNGAPFFAPALILYGAGIGIQSIARGTVPLALFGPAGYPVLMGRLALPARITGAAAPIGVALMIESWGTDAALATLAAAAVLNLAIVAYVVATTRRSQT